MKNSLKSQIVFLIVFVAIFVWGTNVLSEISYSGVLYSDMWDITLVGVPIVITTLIALIYHIVKANKKVSAIILDLVALGIGGLGFVCVLAYIENNPDGHSIDELSIEMGQGFVSCVSISLLVLNVILLIKLIGTAVKSATSKISAKKESSQGFLKKEVTCAVCGKTTGLNRFKMGETTQGDIIWQCAECAKKYSNNYLKIDYTTGKVEVIPEHESEKRIKCNVCGHVYCYNLRDIKKNQRHAKNAALSSVASIGNVVGGTQLGMHANLSRAEKEMDKIMDFSRCPKCNSVDIKELSKEEWENERAKSSREVDNVSVADELKKFKDLLDSGVITQEEFDTKKKQLLGL